MGRRVHCDNKLSNLVPPFRQKHEKVSIASPYIIMAGKTKEINWGFYFGPRGRQIKSKSELNGGNYPDESTTSFLSCSPYSQVFAQMKLSIAALIFCFLLFSQIVLKVNDWQLSSSHTLLCYLSLHDMKKKINGDISFLHQSNPSLFLLMTIISYSLNSHWITVLRITPLEEYGSIYQKLWV